MCPVALLMIDGAYLLWITTIVMKDVYENKGNKDARRLNLNITRFSFCLISTSQPLILNRNPARLSLSGNLTMDSAALLRRRKRLKIKATFQEIQRRGLRRPNWTPSQRQKKETTPFRQSVFCLFAVHVLFLFVRGGIVRSQCFHLVVHFFDGCGF